jgi:hypothetical protein
VLPVRGVRCCPSGEYGAARGAAREESVHGAAKGHGEGEGGGKECAPSCSMEHQQLNVWCNFLETHSTAMVSEGRPPTPLDPSPGDQEA